MTRMRVAWFRPAPATARVLDDTGPLVDELRTTHEVVVYDAATAHQFVPQQARRPFDLSVYEVNDSPAAAFIWPYAMHYPGLLRLRSASLQAQRSRTLLRARRRDDHAAELAAGGAVRLLVMASKLVAVADASFATALQEQHPERRIRCASLGIPAVQGAANDRAPKRRIGVLDTTRIEAIERAAIRARAAGADFDLLVGADPAAAARTCNAIVAMPWPAGCEPPLASLLAMSASCCPIVYETAATAGWPALDPQSWQPRGAALHADPIAVSIDPRDEEHSLMLALRRLSADPALCVRLGAAARAWWEKNATPPAAATVWRELLDEAASLPEPERPATWPPHLTADGTERARAMLSEMGAAVDFLPVFPGSFA